MFVTLTYVALHINHIMCKADTFLIHLTVLKVLDLKSCDETSLQEKDEAEFETYCRIEHVVTSTWLHAENGEYSGTTFGRPPPLERPLNNVNLK